MQPLTFIPLTGLPEITPQSDLSHLLLSVMAAEKPQPGDILVVTHKIISKAGGFVRTLQEITPTAAVQQAAACTHKDSRLMQVIWDCAQKLYACARDIVMVERPDGWVCANAGVDASNAGGKDRLILLPPDCDDRAKELSLALSAALGFSLPVLICDTHGRALRSGATGVCVGSYGLDPVRRYRGQADRDGRILQHTEEAVADELTGGATLVMGQGREGVPAVLARGYLHDFAPLDSSALKRPPDQCLYKLQDAFITLEKN